MKGKKKFRFGDKVRVIKTKSGHKLKHYRKGVVVDVVTIQHAVIVHTEYPNECEFYDIDENHLIRGWKK